MRLRGCGIVPVPVPVRGVPHTRIPPSPLPCTNYRGMQNQIGVAQEMVKEFTVRLEPPSHGHYAPGEVVSGRVIVEVDKPKSYKRICAFLLGKGQLICTYVARASRMHGPERLAIAFRAQ